MIKYIFSPHYKTYTSIKMTMILIVQMVVYSVKSQDPLSIKILESVVKNFSPKQSFRISGIGVYRSDSHMKNPTQLNTYQYNFELIGDVRGANIRIKYVYKTETKEQSRIREYTNHEEYIFDEKKRIYLKSNQENKTDPETETNLFKSYASSPYLLVSYLLHNKDKISFTASEKAGIYFIGVTMPNGENWSLQIDKKKLECVNMKRPYFHYLYGDVSEEIHWRKYVKMADGYFPSEILIRDKGYEQYLFDQKLVFDNTLRFDAGKDSVEIEKRKEPDNMIVSVDSIVLSKISNGLYEVRLSETNNRLMIAEFDDFLILLEGSYHSKNGDEIIDFINRTFPGKPIRYASFGHCHTQYIGFARSHAANGTSIITTEDNTQFIQTLCSASFTLRPDRQEKLKRKPMFEKLVDNTWKYSDAFNAIEIYNIASSHTENYLMFYFPRQKMVFIGDLLWVWENGKPISGRSLVFYNEIVRLGLNVEKYYISWPLKGYPIKTVVNSDEIILSNSMK